MPFADLIYGPRRSMRGIRPTLIDMDTVRELAAKAVLSIDAVELPNNAPGIPTYQKRVDPATGIGGEPVASDDLDSLSAHDRNTLVLTIDRGPARATVSFVANVRSSILAHSDGDPEFGARLETELEDIILDNGKPLWQPHLFAHLLPLGGAGVFVALWIWLLTTPAIPLPAVVLGWIVVVGVVIEAVRWSRRILEDARSQTVTHRIRTETRAETYARRVDAKTNLRVALWTAGVTALLALPGGFLLAVLTDAFGLKG